ncbi:PilN domain-containing protein [Luteimonas aquatica]|uniref:PilN domain-containing protein n=1 Tax=Luteimonas aquatica TaxID=450364 RepID=UPI001F5AEA4F|nr:PilN domain-containing protein [Luteimonas aquatica]
MTSAVDNASATPTSFRQRFGRVGGRLHPGFAGFWTWWTEALASWLPARVRALFGLARERLLLRHDGAQLQLLLQRGDASETIGTIPWQPDAAGAEIGTEDPLAELLTQRVVDLPRWLLLPAGAGLRRRLTLPAAAAERLRDVAAFEIDRQTPFAATDVHYDARVAARRGDQLDVELVVVPRATFDRALSALGPLGATLAGVDVVDGDDRPLGINLLSDTRRRRRSDPWRVWNHVFIVVALLALGVGLWQILDNRRQVADELEREADRHGNQARQAAALKRQLINQVEGLRFLQEARAGRPTAVEVIDELARRLPDTTYIEKLAIEDTRLTLIGQSSEASALVIKLEGSKLWRQPALAGALQPDPRTRRDRFTLTAELAVTDAAKSQPGGADARTP